MPVLSGPKLEAIVTHAVSWYTTRRQTLIKAMEERYPYGSVRLTPTEQLTRFLEMSPDDWSQMIVALHERYRGLPDAYDRVDRDLQAYTNRMLRLKNRQSVPLEEEPYA